MKKFILPESKKAELLNFLSENPYNPYKDYVLFKEYISDNLDLIKNNIIFQFCNDIKRDQVNDINFHVIKNCPLDVNKIKLSLDNSLEDKYKRKKTFISEGFLTLISIVTEKPILAYTTRNNGDMFNDVIGEKKYANTQTQKSNGELYYHNDRTAHSVRADYLSLLGVNCNDDDLIITVYVHGADIINELDDSVINLLKQPYYYTPFDDLSRSSNKNQVVSNHHRIIMDDGSIRYYDTRTTFIEDCPKEAIVALLKFKDAILKTKKSYYQLKEGDLLMLANVKGLHSRIQLNVSNDKDNDRWLLKTYNFESISKMQSYASHYAEVDGLVVDSK